MRKYLAVKIGLLLALLFLILSMFGWDLLKDMGRLQVEASVVETSNHQSHVLHDIEMSAQTSLKVVKDFLVARDNRLEEQFLDIHGHLQASIQRYEKMYADDSLQNLSLSMQRMKNKAMEIFHLKFNEGNMEAPILAEEIENEMKEGLYLLGAKHHDLDSQVNQAMQMVEGLQLDMHKDITVLLVILLMALLFLTFFIYWYIVIPLVQMRGAAKQIGAGKFDVQCDVSSQDEIGELGKAFNAMGAALLEREQKLNRVRSLAAHHEKMDTLGIMSAGIAHEVGNPLSAVAMSLEVAKRKLIKGDLKAVGNSIQQGLKESERMANIIQMVLNFGRNQVGEGFKKFSVLPVLEQALQLVKMIPKHKKVPVTLCVNKDLPLIFGSPEMLLQVVMNLIHNAFSACHQGGNVRISAFQSAEGITIEVMDTGAGVPDKVKQDIFKPSFSSKKKNEGFGFGLAISKELVDAMHGYLILMEQEGRGARFRIWLPFATGESHT